MVQAYILVQTEVGRAADVARQIAEIAGVTQAEDVTGPYDVIVRAVAENVDELGKLVAAQIQASKGSPGPSPARWSGFERRLRRGRPPACSRVGEELRRDLGGPRSDPKRNRCPQVIRRIHVLA